MQYTDTLPRIPSGWPDAWQDGQDSSASPRKATESFRVPATAQLRCGVWHILTASLCWSPPGNQGSAPSWSPTHSCGSCTELLLWPRTQDPWIYLHLTQWQHTSLISAISTVFNQRRMNCEPSVTHGWEPHQSFCAHFFPTPWSASSTLSWKAHSTYWDGNMGSRQLRLRVSVQFLKPDCDTPHHTQQVTPGCCETGSAGLPSSHPHGRPIKAGLSSVTCKPMMGPAQAEALMMGTNSQHSKGKVHAFSKEKSTIITFWVKHAPANYSFWKHASTIWRRSDYSPLPTGMCPGGMMEARHSSGSVTAECFKVMTSPDAAKSKVRAMEQQVSCKELTCWLLRANACLLGAGGRSGLYACFSVPGLHEVSQSNWTL